MNQRETVCDRPIGQDSWCPCLTLLALPDSNALRLLAASWQIFVLLHRRKASHLQFPCWHHQQCQCKPGCHGRPNSCARLVGDVANSRNTRTNVSFWLVTLLPCYEQKDAVRTCQLRPKISASWCCFPFIFALIFRFGTNRVIGLQKVCGCDVWQSIMQCTSKWFQWTQHANRCQSFCVF